MIKRASLLLMLAAAIFAPVAAQANDPNYTMTMMVHTKGLTTQYTGHVKITYQWNGEPVSRESSALGSLPARFRLPSMARNVVIVGTFAKHGGKPVTEEKRLAYAEENVVLDFSRETLKYAHDL